MAQQTVNIGSSANDGTGDPLRTAFDKINDNFTELYTASTVSHDITLSGNKISTGSSNANLKLEASGTGVIELEGIQIRDNHIEGTRSNEDLTISASGTGNLILGALRVNGTTISADDSSKITFAEAVDITGSLTTNVISSNDSSAIQINDGVNISGTLSANTIDTNTISSSDSTAIQIDDGVNINGLLSANTIDTNRISSSDSSAVTIADNVIVSGTLTASGGITGIVALTRGDITDGEASTSSSTIANLDTFTLATYRAAKYEVSISDTTNSRFALHSIYVVHDGSNAYITDTVVSSTGSGMATFTADIDSGNVRVRMVPISANAATYKFIKQLIKQ